MYAMDADNAPADAAPADSQAVDSGSAEFPEAQEAAPAKPPTEDLNDVSESEMEEYANKLHDKAGADKMFTEDK